MNSIFPDSRVTQYLKDGTNCKITSPVLFSIALFDFSFSLFFFLLHFFQKSIKLNKNDLIDTFSWDGNVKVVKIHKIYLLNYGIISCSLH